MALPFARGGLLDRGIAETVSQISFRPSGVGSITTFHPRLASLRKNVEIGGCGLERVRLQAAPYIVFKDLRHG
jgi:hypothetical protein